MITASPVLQAFSGYGIELEYMIVDRDTLAVLPLADELLRSVAGALVAEVGRGRFAWSNELVLHLVEIKNARPAPDLAPLIAGFQAQVWDIDARLADFGARLMPTATHPWMDPSAETRLWPHDNADIYRAYHRIFNCRRHGWANLQSMHLNLPFAGDAEFERLHAAVRLLLPVLPALAASSPIVDGNAGGIMDFRLEAYRFHPLRVPSLIGRVIPENASSRAEYEACVLAPMYRDIAPHDTAGVLRHEWLNARGAIPRFDRSAIEIRVIDVQECPQADLAVAAATAAAAGALYAGQWSALAQQQAAGTQALAEIMQACIRDADRAVIDDAGYLRLLGFRAGRCEARELWHHLVESAAGPAADQLAACRAPLDVILERGALARRILRALGESFDRPRLQAVYRELCDCLEQGRLFRGSP